MPVAYLLYAGAADGRRFAIAWNVLGLVDFAIAIAIGMLTSLEIIVPDRSVNAQLGTFPTVLIPTFAVPSSIILHALSLWQLFRMRRAPAPLVKAAA